MRTYRAGCALSPRSGVVGGGLNAQSGGLMRMALPPSVEPPLRRPVRAGLFRLPVDQPLGEQLGEQRRNRTAILVASEDRGDLRPGQTVRPRVPQRDQEPLRVRVAEGVTEHEAGG